MKHDIVKSIEHFHVLSVKFDLFKQKYDYYCGHDNDYMVNDKVNEEYANIIIQDKLYLGDGKHSKKEQMMKDFRITHILNCTKDYCNKFEDKGIKYLRIPINDNETDDIFQHFEDAISYINEGDIVFVHCQAGVSRSASIVIAYLMKTQNMDYQQAYQFVKAKREWISPNDGFIEQLQRFHTQILKR